MHHQIKTLLDEKEIHSKQKEHLNSIVNNLKEDLLNKEKELFELQKR